MTEKEKLIIALMQIDSLTELLQGNEYQQFLYSHLISTQVELQRQLSHYG
jgi:sRNA-binding regulator protein Hfq